MWKDTGVCYSLGIDHILTDSNAVQWVTNDKPNASWRTYKAGKNEWQTQPKSSDLRLPDFFSLSRLFQPCRLPTPTSVSGCASERFVLPSACNRLCPLRSILLDWLLYSALTCIGVVVYTSLALSLSMQIKIFRRTLSAQSLIYQLTGQIFGVPGLERNFVGFGLHRLEN